MNNKELKLFIVLGFGDEVFNGSTNFFFEIGLHEKKIYWEMNS